MNHHHNNNNNNPFVPIVSQSLDKFDCKSRSINQRFMVCLRFKIIEDHRFYVDLT